MQIEKHNFFSPNLRLRFGLKYISILRKWGHGCIPLLYGVDSPGGYIVFHRW